MTPYGSDRLRPGHGSQWILLAVRSKGWTARVPKTALSAEHPGTAVLWDDQWFEVVEAGPAEVGGVRYLLEPWSDHHVIRLSQSYDEASEREREKSHHDAVTRERGRKMASLAGVFTGLLPASAQEQLGSELGLLPVRLTSLSLLLPLAFLIWLGRDMARRILERSAPMPLALILLGIYLFVESVIRLNIAWFHRRPIGSLLGFVPYLLFHLLGGKAAGAVSPFAVGRGEGIYRTDPSADVALRDAFTLREPLLCLLSAGEQKALASRFGYQYRRHAVAVAWLILCLSVAGAATSLSALRHGPRLSALVSLIVAVVLGVEQMLRLPALRRGPAGSVLAFAVRPLARKLLQ